MPCPRLMVSAEASAKAGNTDVKCQLAKAVGQLSEQNDAALTSAAYLVAEVGDLEASQQRACASVAAGLRNTFSPEVLDILKSNADQLFQLKQAVTAEKQAAKENSKKMLLWMTGSSGGGEQQGGSNTAAAQASGTDAIKQRGFRPLQLAGSSIATVQPPSSGSTWQALKFWQIGTQNSKHVRSSRATGDTPGLTDQQPQKSLSSMLFGKHKRHSAGGAAEAASRRVSIDPAASWRSSMDGSFNGRRASTRSSDAGAAAALAATSAAGGLAAAGSNTERGAVMTSLAAGEGPLSKSHSMLATKPGTQQEQILGKSLEIVAEDEREGRDSPVPAEPCARRMGSAGQPVGLAPIRVPRGSINRPGSPGESFSFGQRQEEEQAHSPSFVRASSVSSRLAHSAGMAGPLVRSSTALRASMVTRVDPFEAPEPEPQPFVEQLKAEQQDTAAAAAAQGSIMAALRRSISGGGRASVRWEANDVNPRRTPRQSMEGAVAGWSGPAAPSASQQMVPRQLQQGSQQQQQQMVSEGGASVQFLDLDATRAYALGVHQVMMRLEQNMQSVHSQSEASSRPTSPRGNSITDAASTGNAAAAVAAVTATDSSPAADGAAGSGTMVAAAQPDCTRPDSQTAVLETQHQQQPPSSPQQQQQGDRGALGQMDGSTPGSARTPRAESESAGGVPPLRSGMSSPAASRRQTHLGGGPPPAAARQLPLMGQASMEILEKPSQLTASRQQSLVGPSTSMSLAEVYKQTSGNLAPLSSHLSGIGRRTSSTASKGLPSQRAAGGPLAASSSRSILGEAPAQPGAAGGMGPLAMQYGSTMQQAKKSAAAAGLGAAGAVGGPQEQRVSGWGLQQGASSPLALPAPESSGLDPGGLAANNKYASSWGILDAGGLSRQSSMSGAAPQVSRAPSGLTLTRQGSSSVRASPRQSNADEQQQAGAWQQQRLRGAAGRYAGASQTPGSQSPRSGTATPAREDSTAAAAGMLTVQPGSGRRRVAGPGSARQAEQGAGGGRGGSHARDGSTVGSEDYESAEEQLSSGPSGVSGLSGPYGSASGAFAAASAAGLPNPPAFLSGRPTSAQAAVATQWSPSKHAAAFAQAPAYMRDAVLRISPEVSGPASYGLAPAGLQVATSRGVSPRESNAAAATGASGRVSSSSIGGRPSQTSMNEGGYNIYAPLDPPSARSQSGRLQQQQQPVVTAVDLARRQSVIRRASSTGVQQAAEYGGSSSSNGRASNSNMGGYTQSSFHSSNGFGTFPGGRQQQQQQWGSGSQSGSIYGTIRPGPWQRQQYKF